MKILGRILLFIILLPMWIIWLMFDLAAHGEDYENWEIYNIFFKD